MSTRMQPTERADRGQVFVLFALSLVTIVLFAALAFDVGSMALQRRDQLNAADAAALAGARYLIPQPATTQGRCSLLSSPPRAVSAACEIAAENGYRDGENNATVTVNIPPVQSSTFRGLPGFIEVIIGSRQPTIFGGIAGAAGWNVGAAAVAANQHGLELPFSMLALDPTLCAALKVAGSGVVTANGTVQVNSNCVPDALLTSGQGTLTVTAEGATCNAVGEITVNNNATLDCVQREHSYAITDPLRNLPAPPVPDIAPAIQQVSGPSKSIPAHCPGNTTKPPDPKNPQTCTFGGSYDGTAWRVYPGYYPGGLSFGKGMYYLEPGIYYIGGGGFRAAGGAVRSVDPGTTSFGGGVLIYNSEAQGYDNAGNAFHAKCENGTATPAECIAPIVLNGGQAEVNLKQLNDDSAWDGLVIFQDRTLDYSLADPSLTDVQINGGASTMEVAGTIYVPKGNVVVNGSSGTLTLDQVIARTFTINGNGGTIQVLYRSGVTFTIAGVGLVE
ncbi:MAG TPA: pilus assembly protein TadG-related protein [Candidatus Limnocylindrales bacterium]|nr:pilus assembly protein TadG-related protein [Candidatus Limnocylindrales bacterium]